MGRDVNERVDPVFARLDREIKGHVLFDRFSRERSSAASPNFLPITFALTGRYLGSFTWRRIAASRLGIEGGE